MIIALHAEGNVKKIVKMEGVYSIKFIIVTITTTITNLRVTQNEGNFSFLRRNLHNGLLLLYNNSC
jgi:hypothetical protein